MGLAAARDVQTRRGQHHQLTRRRSDAMVRNGENEGRVGTRVGGRVSGERVKKITEQEEIDNSKACFVT